MPSANWILAAAWAWLALAAFAACVWDRARHRLRPLQTAHVGRMAGVALLVACGLAAWGWWQPMKTAAPDAAAAVLWRSMGVVVATLHLAAAATLLGGSIYLAFGRLLGTRACSACGWQAMIIERLPEAAVATAVTAVGVAVFQGSAVQVDRDWVTGTLLIMRVGVVWLLLLVNRSVPMVRQPALWRTGFVWFTLFQVGRVGWRFCHDIVAGDTVTADWLAGGACGVALVVLAAGLHRQALLLGLRFDRPAALAEIVGGLSPLRRLAACAVGGLFLAGLCGLRLFLLRRNESPSEMAGQLIVAVALLWLLVTWGAALIRDRLGPACSPSISAATVTLLVGLGSIWATTAGGFDPGSSAIGRGILLASLALVAVGIGWCSLTAWRPSQQTG